MTDTADDLAISDLGEGKIAAAQGWRCPTCGGPLPGCGSVLALARPREAGGTAIAIVIHEACKHDARRLQRLSKYPDLDDDARAAAAEARSGAVEFARRSVAVAETTSNRITAAERRATKAEQRAVTAEKRAAELQGENQELRDAAYTATARSPAGKP